MELFTLELSYDTCSFPGFMSKWTDRYSFKDLRDTPHAGSWSSLSLSAQLFLHWHFVLKFKLPEHCSFYLLKSVSVMCYAWVPPPSASVWKLPLETGLFIGPIFFYSFRDHSPGWLFVPILCGLKRFVYFIQAFSCLWWKNKFYTMISSLMARTHL